MDGHSPRTRDLKSSVCYIGSSLGSPARTFTGTANDQTLRAPDPTGSTVNNQ